MVIVDISAMSLASLIFVSLLIGYIIREALEEKESCECISRHTHVFLPAREQRWLGEDGNIMARTEKSCVVCGETKYTDAFEVEEDEEE